MKPAAQPSTFASGQKRLDHIDGLRAIAVGLVLWFHAQLPGVPNGFLGVDVFFVISGFLIPLQIVDGIAAGKFKIADFFARRILRLAPPLLLVIAAVLIAASVLPLLPSDTKRIAWSAAASLGLSANFFFLSGAGYFAVASEREPLLHLWSLAVEEQFYLIAPPAMIVIAALTRRMNRSFLDASFAVSAVLLVVALGATAAFAATKPMQTFYLMPLRAWEFSAGTLAALALRRGWTVDGPVARWGVAAGLVAILFAACLETKGVQAQLVLQIVSVLGAAAVLFFAHGAHRGMAMTLLQSRPLVGIGLISYALYLWHWPLLSFWRLLSLETPNVTTRIALGILLPLLLAIVSYVAIEKPLREWRKRTLTTSRRRILLQGIGASALLAFVSIGIAVWANALRNDPRFRAFEDARQVLMPKCLMGLRKETPLAACSLGDAAGLRVVLWGDSHALSLSDAVANTANAAKLGATLQWDGGCPPLAGQPLYINGQVWASCMNRNRAVIQWLASQAPAAQTVTGVVLGGAWSLHFGHASPEKDRAIALPALTSALRVTLHTLRGLGLRVLVVGPVPTLPFNAVECLWLSADQTRRCDKPGQDLARDHDNVSAAIKASTDGLDDVRYIDPAPAFCDSGSCEAGRGDRIFYSDNNHLSAAGAQAVRSRFADDFRWVFAAAERQPATKSPEPAR